MGLLAQLSAKNSEGVKDVRQIIRNISAENSEGVLARLSANISSVQSRQRMILLLGGGHKLFYKNPVHDVRRDVSYSPC